MSQESSQSSALDVNELNKLEESSKPENTRKVTSWGVNVFKSWCSKRQLENDLFTVSSDVLSTTLRQFYAEVKTKKGKPLSPSSLLGIRASLH